MNPIRSSLRYPAVTLTLTLGLLLLGTQAILHMPRMEDPSVTIRTGIVAAVYPGATSDQVESQLLGSGAFCLCGCRQTLC